LNEHGSSLQAERFRAASLTLYTWIHEEWAASFPVQCALLQQRSDAECDDLETQWMTKFPNLLNDNKYYYSGDKPPVVPEIKEYMSRFVFNSGGYRGIHWWRQLDRYSVFLYIGHRQGWRWLDGDGAPGWTGDIWFSDLKHALEVREKYREHYTWLPDIEQEADVYSEPLRCFLSITAVIFV
jgi:hypothetical protein